MVALGSFLDGGFRKTGDLEKAASHGRGAKGVEGGGGFGLVSGDGGEGIEFRTRADGHFDIVKSALGFDDAVPAERGTGFGECRDPAGGFAAVGAGFESGDGIAMVDEAQDEIEEQCSERKRGAKFSARAFAAGADFFSDQPAEHGEKNSGEKDGENPEIEVGDAVQGEAARGKGPEEFDAGGLAEIED